MFTGPIATEQWPAHSRSAYELQASLTSCCWWTFSDRVLQHVILVEIMAEVEVNHRSLSSRAASAPVTKLVISLLSEGYFKANTSIRFWASLIDEKSNLSTCNNWTCRWRNPSLPFGCILSTDETRFCFYKTKGTLFSYMDKYSNWIVERARNTATETSNTIYSHLHCVRGQMSV